MAERIKMTSDELIAAIVEHGEANACASIKPNFVLSDAVVIGCALEHLRLPAYTTFSNVSFYAAGEINRQGPFFAHADFHTASFYGCTFGYGADFTEANLEFTSFSNCCFWDCCFEGASLRNATLLNCSLEGADMAMCVLAGAEFIRVSFLDAKGFITIGPIGSRGDILRAVISPSGWRVTTGCFEGDLADFKQSIDKTYYTGEDWWSPYMYALDFLRSIEDEYKVRYIMDREDK